MHVIAALHRHRQCVTKRLCEILSPRPKRDNNIARGHGALLGLHRPAFRALAQRARIAMQKHAALALEECRISERQRTRIGNIRGIFVMDRADNALLQIRFARRQLIGTENVKAETIGLQLLDILDRFTELRLIAEQLDPA